MLWSRLRPPPGARRLVLEVGKQNHAAIGLYERHGFVATEGARTLPEPRQPIRDREMALDLSRPVGR